jgi:hypothetical protein
VVILFVVHCFLFADFSTIVTIAATVTMSDQGVDQDEFLRAATFEKFSDLCRTEHHPPLLATE